MNTIAKYFNTLKYLKFSQVYNRFIFKFTNPKVNLESIPLINENFANKVEFPKFKNVLFGKGNFMITILINYGYTTCIILII